MPRHRKQAPPENHERWLISYADFITLLFAFFVVMYASSQADRSRAAEVSASVRHAFEKPLVAKILGGTTNEKGPGNAMMKGPGGAERATPQKTPDGNLADPASQLHLLEEELAREIQAGKMQVRLESRGLVVSLREAAFFPSGEESILPQAYPSLAKVAEAIRKLPSPVRLEGHTDSIPIHNLRFRSNWELSSHRAVATLVLFTERFSLPANRFAVAGYADTAPLASNETEDGRSRNRRVDVVILNEKGSVGEPGKN